MADNEKKWPAEVFLTVFNRVEQRFILKSGRRRITSRRIAKITKGVLAAQAALEYSIAGGDSDVSNQEATSREDC